MADPMDDTLPSRFGRSLFGAFLKLQQWAGGREEGAAPEVGAVLEPPAPVLQHSPAVTLPW